MFFTRTNKPHPQTSSTGIRTQARSWQLLRKRQIQFQIEYSRALSAPSITHSTSKECEAEPQAHKNVCCVLKQGSDGEGADYCGHQREKSWQVWKSPL